MTQLPPAVRWPDDERAAFPSRTPLFGRQPEVAALIALINDGPSLVTINGTGGIGKTRLAVEVARQMGHQPVFVQLADADRPAEVVDGRGVWREGDAPGDVCWVRITVAGTGHLSEDEFVAILRDEVPAHVRIEEWVGSRRVLSTVEEGR
jgi:MoxR-like ATPase